MTALLWTYDDLLAGCGGALFDPTFACDSISGIEIDSRNCKLGDLFVALVGDTRDGHDFITKAADAAKDRNRKGVRAAGSRGLRPPSSLVPESTRAS